MADDFSVSEICDSGDIGTGNCRIRARGFCACLTYALTGGIICPHLAEETGNGI
jgi:hypothetical protein